MTWPLVAAAETGLLQILLDFVDRPRSAAARILAELAPGPPLPQQVPALVEFDLDPAQPIMLLRLGDVAALQPRPQVFLLGDQVADACQCVAVGRFAPVAHGSSVPDMSGVLLPTR